MGSQANKIPPELIGKRIVVAMIGGKSLKGVAQTTSRENWFVLKNKDSGECYVNEEHVTAAVIDEKGN